MPGFLLSGGKEQPPTPVILIVIFHESVALPGMGRSRAKKGGEQSYPRKMPEKSEKK